ncbi:hypothetical protein [Persicobacter psychrovividus]|uniref:Helicase/UvrB N-terminal domain-containing protein n=1 Tax=Persicobacter psychrovividus TaxID=387638 RepID=A0ABM7VNA5_9BACT|nr:hypothetical protein PEPS_47740 [Persicobacter psychrovividus]
MEHSKSTYPNPLKTILKDKITKGFNKGIDQINLQTGGGKTFTTCEVIAEEVILSDEHDIERVLFTTLQYKNLPDDLMLELLEKKGVEDAWQHVLLLESNRKWAERVFGEGRLLADQDYLNAVISCFRDRETEFKEIFDNLNSAALEYLEDRKNKRKGQESEKNFTSALSRMKQAVFEEVTKKLTDCQEQIGVKDLTRKQTLGLFFKEAKAWRSDVDRDLVNEFIPYRWLGELFPEMRCWEAKVIFLTFDKLYYANKINSHLFDSLPLIPGLSDPQNYLLIIDEFDLFKKKIEDVYLNSTLNQPLGLYSSVKKLILLTDEPQSDVSIYLNNFCDKYKIDRPSSEKLEKKREGFSTKVKNLSGLIDIYRHLEDRTESASIQNTTFSTDRTKLFLPKYSYGERVRKAENRNEIITNKIEYEQVDDVSLNFLTRQLQRLLTEFVSTYVNLSLQLSKQISARMYQEHNDQTHDVQLLVTDETIFKAILYHYGIAPGDPLYVGMMELRFIFTVLRGNKILDVQEPFLDLIAVKTEGSTSIDQCDIHLFRLMRAEYLMASFSDRYQIIGLSATALLEGLGTNFNHELLEKICSRFDSLNAKECKSIQKVHDDYQQKSFEKRDIKTGIIKCPKKPKVDDLKVLLPSYATAPAKIAKLSTFAGKFEGKSYQLRRLIKLAMAYKEMITRPRLVTGLFFAPNLFSESTDADYQRKELKELFTMVYRDVFDVDHKVAKEKVNEAIKFISTDKFEEGMKAFDDSLKDIQPDDFGKFRDHRIIITSYGTMGAGVNPQVSRRDWMEVVQVDPDHPNKSEKVDVQFIYCEQKSFITPVLSGNKAVELKDKLSAIYTITDMVDFGMISHFGGIKAMQSFISSPRYPKHPIIVNEVKKGSSYYVDAVNYWVIQALGRGSRSNWKPIDSMYMVDDETAEFIALHELSDKNYYTAEFQLLHQYCVEHSGEKTIERVSPEQSHILKMVNKSIESANYMQRTFGKYRRTPFEGHEIDKWNLTKEFILKHPTVNKSDLPDGKDYMHLQDLYLYPIKGKLNGYGYSKEADFKNVEITFNKEDFSDYSVLNEQAMNLDKIHKIGGKLLEFWKEKGFADTVAKKHYMLHPPAFTNLYKGYQGEVIGKWFFENYLFKDKKLVGLGPDHYERFDFVLEGTGLYFDFKNWSNDTQYNSEEWFFKKLEKVGGHTAVICNIFSLPKADLPFIIENKGYPNRKLIFVPYLYHFDEEGEVLPLQLSTLKSQLSC